jgi:hypothetical protein
MKMPSTPADLADIDWTDPDVRYLTLRDLHAWDRLALRAPVLQPISDEAAWEGTEIDVRRLVL